MARVYGITLPAGIDVIYNKTLKMYDIAVNCNIGKNRRFLTRKMRINLRDFTKLYQIAALWQTFTQPQKDAWQAAATAMGTTNYNLFTQDQIYRLMNGIFGQATPDIYHQYLVGHVELAGAATAMRMHQYHNTPWQNAGTLSLNYHSDLVATGGTPSVVLRIIAVRYYSGKNNTVIVGEELDLSAGWQTVVVPFPDYSGRAAHYTVEIEFTDVQGDFWFDNYFVEWDGQLQNKDPFCDELPKYWYLPNFPVGATVESVYPLGAAL